MRQLLHVILFNVNIFFAITFTFFGKKVSPMNPLEMSEEIQKFPERLKSAIGARSARAFAFECGLSPAAIHQYLAGKTEPTRLALIAIAHTAGVNLEWLMTGKGSKDKGDMYDVDIYDGIIEAVENFIRKAGKALPMEKKREIYHHFYELHTEGQVINTDYIEKTLRLVS